jgi:hypothetical protein
LNRKDRKERKEDPFVRNTQKTYCDVFAFFAVLAVQLGIRDLDLSTFSGCSSRCSHNPPPLRRPSGDPLIADS